MQEADRATIDELVCVNRDISDTCLSKREAFARAAMQGFLSCNIDKHSFAELAQVSMDAADALLEELAK